MPGQHPASSDDYHRYVDLVQKDGAPHVSVDRLFSYPNVSRMAMLDMRTPFETPEREPDFDFVFGLPSRGPVVAGRMADYSERGSSQMHKGKRFSGDSHLTVKYKKSDGTIGYLQVQKDLFLDIPSENPHTRSVLLTDVELANGHKALGAREALRALERHMQGIYIKLAGYACIVEFGGRWKGKEYRGREILEEEGIKVMSLVVFEDGEFKPRKIERVTRVGEVGGRQRISVTEKFYPETPKSTEEAADNGFT